MEMDTDSAYMALSADTLEDVIRPEMRERFYEEYGKWFPRPYCQEHRKAFINGGMQKEQWEPRGECCLQVLKHERRTPGLFKEEFNGDGVVALNSKTYFCWCFDSEKKSKYSTKGLSKRTNVLTRQHFLDVLKTKESFRGVNKGFQKKNNNTYTYNQIKTGLTYFYAKRYVNEDGVTTSVAGV